MKFPDNSFPKKVLVTFKSNPKAAFFHFTSDGIAFKDPENAKVWARKLKDKSVKKITKEMADEMQESGHDLVSELQGASEVEAAKPLVPKTGNEFLDVLGPSADVEEMPTKLEVAPTELSGDALTKEIDDNQASVDRINEAVKADEHEAMPDANDLPDIQAWLSKRGVKYAKNAKAASLMVKVAEYQAQQK